MAYSVENFYIVSKQFLYSVQKVSVKHIRELKQVISPTPALTCRKVGYPVQTGNVHRTNAVCLNPLKAGLNPICRLLASVGAHHILHLSRWRWNFL